MHYTPLPEKTKEYPMQAIYEDTPPAANSPWVMPGRYVVRLTAGGKTYSQPITVKMDPRVQTTAAGLLQQFTLSKAVYDDLMATNRTMDEIRAFRAGLKNADLDKSVQALQGESMGRFGRRGTPGPDSFSTVEGTLTSLLQALQEADVAPTSQTVAAVENRRAALKKLMQRWDALKAQNTAE
jgi:hypothetical protein